MLLAERSTDFLHPWPGNATCAQGMRRPWSMELAPRDSLLVKRPVMPSSTIYCRR
jgi:hypothetical protein